MVKVRMHRSQNGSDVDSRGVSTKPRVYFAGEEYEVGEALAKAFCEDLKCAERVGSKGSDPHHPTSAPDPEAHPDKFEGAPENKAELPAEPRPQGRGARRRR